MSITVLHYLRHLGLGGTEKTCQLFFENATSDFNVCVVYEKTGDHPRLNEFQKSAKVSTGQLIEIDSYHGDPQSDPDPKPLQEIIDVINPDILHVYRSGYSEFPVGDVVVPHVVETNVFGFIEDPSRIDSTLFMSKWLMDYALRRIAPIKRAFAFKSNRFDFVNNPVEKPYTDQKIFGLSSDIIWLGRCGRPDNGIYNAVSVEAARLLRMQGYNVGFLVMAPPSNMVDDLAIYEMPFKVFEPTVDPLTISQFYNSIDIYAHARADGETFGVNIAEAMMHGKPVVTHIATPSVPGMGVFQSQTELVDNDQTGYIVNNDPAEYAEALRKLIDAPKIREQMGYAAIAKAMREYHVDVCQRKLENIYRNIVLGDDPGDYPNEEEPWCLFGDGYNV
jgi:glycosyltransferase involved in cell wall biosynthesis